jgi:transcriptional regulator with XRE-family HTH domain
VDERAIYRAFGRAVADRRRSMNKTQLQVAQEIGLSRPSLANIERGEQKVFLHQILALVEALELENSHEIVPSRAPPPETTYTKRQVSVSGAKNLSKDQKVLVHRIVGRFGDTKRASK